MGRCTWGGGPGLVLGGGLSLVLGWGGCGASAFECEQSSQCLGDGAEGVCQQSGYCSFPDEGCPSGQRYGDHAGNGLAGECVPVSEGSSGGTTEVAGSTGGVTTHDPIDGTTLAIEGSSSETVGPADSSTGVPSCGAATEACCDGVGCDEGTCIDGVCQPCTAWVEAEEEFSCAAHSDGQLSCWGSDDDGQVGDGPPNVFGGVPTPVAVLNGITEFDLGAFHACAIASTPWCWGRNDYGQLGLGMTSGSESVPVALDPPEPFDIVAAGGFHVCARGTSGQVYCWGRNNDGQVQGFGIVITSPEPVPNVPTAVAVDTGGFHSCAIDGGGEVTCWGRSGDGQLGHPGSWPGLVQGLPEVEQLALGDYHSCALDLEGQPWCWGRNGEGQLAAPGFVDESIAPLLVQGVPPLVDLDSGDDHVCGVTDSGEVWCWGSNQDGQLGGGPGNDQRVPILVPFPPAVHVTGGRSHTCVTATDGRVWCVGRNDRGQLGDGTNLEADDPVEVTGLCPG
ncbi:RCC1 domain-containing protein [Paraliomyxa miuraensis]|uniref:RCC1 domain-containing protein n=1 Tax=Paraliomyxa miuraensis TaxID=376150 RepID=UPI00224CDFD6|nr:hypothetical protein [Paraliomyxa miuraensis]MCX4245496.1 hypothetical protein [Paraliomyxa miuraensis]